MSYNKQVDSFVKGDLVYFTGYHIEANPLKHKIGIVMSNGTGAKHYMLYEVMWVHSGDIMTVAAKHLTLAYIKE